MRPEPPEDALPWCRDNVTWHLDAPPWPEVEPEARRMLEGVDDLVAHNVSFDVGRIEGMSHRAGGSATWLPKYWLDTVSLAWMRFGDELESLSLAQVARALSLRQEAAHTSLDDVRVLQEVFSALTFTGGPDEQRA